MHLLDTTMFFCHRGGGVKKYLLAKHAWLGKFAAPVRHTLLVPGPLPAFSDVLSTTIGPLPIALYAPLARVPCEATAHPPPSSPRSRTPSSTDRTSQGRHFQRQRQYPMSRQ